MATKTEIETLIASTLTGNPGVLDWAEQEDMLKDNTASILENVYGDALEDTQILETYTSSNANFNYIVSIHKVGSTITITGSFTVNTTNNGGDIFTITDTDLQCSTDAFYSIAYTRNNLEVMPIFIVNDTLKVEDAVFSGDRYAFTISYKSLN